MASRSSTSDIFILLLLVTACVVGLMAIWKIRFKEEAPAPKIIVQTEVQKPLPTPPPAPTPSPAPSTLQVTRPRATPPGMVCDGENAICVNKNYENTLLTNPFSVTGTIQELNGKTIFSRLETADGKDLPQSASLQVTTTSQGLSFSLRAFIVSLPHTATGTLVITNGSASPLRIPVRLPRESMNVTIYTLGLAEDAKKDGYTCPDEPLKVISKEERTIPKTNLPVEATLRAAIGGGDESGIASFSVANKIANVVFEKDFHGERDACAWRLETASWERTLQQFSSVNQVVFSREP